MLETFAIIHTNLELGGVTKISPSFMAHCTGREMTAGLDVNGVLEAQMRLFCGTCSSEKII